MKLSEFIDEIMDRDVMDIIYQDENGNELELDPFQVQLSNVVMMYYQKIVVIKIKKT